MATLSDENTITANNRDLIVAAVLALCWILLAAVVDTRLGAILDKQRQLASTDDYHSAMVPLEPLAWFEMTSADGTRILGSADIILNVYGFEDRALWNQRVSFAALSSDRAELEVSFPPQVEVSSVALFMTDGDQLGRIVRIRSGPTVKVAESLHNGRWIYLHVSDREQQAGHKKIEFTPINAGVALSAVAVVPL